MRMISFSDFRFQGEEIETLRRQIEEHHMVHALLITGEPGTGKRTLAQLLATALLCESGKDIPCGKCTGCKLASSGEHPDLTVIEKGVPLSRDTARGRSTIPVDDIREMIRICSQYSFEGGNRVVMIPDAENMTLQAQNCLLKIIEEPPEHTFFLLTSGHSDQLLSTVRSRCRPLKLKPWETSYIQDFLINTGVNPEIAEKAASASFGSIGNAIRLVSDDRYWKLRDEIMDNFFCNRNRSNILSISSAWKDRKSDAETLFNVLEDHIRQLLQCRLYPGLTSVPKEFPESWQRFASDAPLERFSGLIDRIREARKQNTFNVNFQAIIEQLLLSFSGETDLWKK